MVYGKYQLALRCVSECETAALVYGGYQLAVSHALLRILGMTVSGPCALVRMHLAITVSAATALLQAGCHAPLSRPAPPSVPSTFTFSPALVPRPPDWGSHVCVSGPLLLPLQLAEAQQAAAEGVDDTAGSSSHSGSQGAGGGGGGGGGGFSSYVPPSDLVAFLEAEPGGRGVQRMRTQTSVYGQHVYRWFVVGKAYIATTRVVDNRRVGTGWALTAATCARHVLIDAAIPPYPWAPPVDRPPVYIGFGSMTVAEGRYVAAAIRTAVADCGVRAVVSAGGWGCIARVDEDGGAAGQQEQQGGGVGSGGKGSTSSGSSRDIFVVQDVPHEWLFPRCVQGTVCSLIP